uniref:Isoform 12 of CKLF-like MARVEL transmembrane domain-containing protein 1 n=1 Tax=Homo sapiens TaxID=9606 RepID=Q8IZ96-12|nr:chemokine-like factor super family 1 isoform 12 [Homo sapiens]
MDPEHAKLTLHHLLTYLHRPLLAAELSLSHRMPSTGSRQSKYEQL